MAHINFLSRSSSLFMLSTQIVRLSFNATLRWQSMERKKLRITCTTVVSKSKHSKSDDSLSFETNFKSHKTKMKEKYKWRNNYKKYTQLKYEWGFNIFAIVVIKLRFLLIIILHATILIWFAAFSWKFICAERWLWLKS